MKLLVISLAGNGDTLFATPLIHELRANFPDAQIDAFVRWRAAKDLLARNPHLNAVHQKDLPACSKAEALKCLFELRAKRYDMSFNTHPQSRIHYRAVARFINARFRVSHRYENFGFADRLLATHTAPQQYDRHAIDNNLALLELVGAKTVLPEHDYELYLSGEEKRWADDFIVRHKLAGRFRLGIHVGSGGTKNLALRRWPLEHYIALINRLRQTHPGVAVLLFGGPDEEVDHQRVSNEADRNQVFIVRSGTLREAAALVGTCDAFLSVDTVFMHLAATLHVPSQFVIETPTWNKPIEPYRNPFVLIPNPAVAGRNLEFYRYDGGDIQGSPEDLRRCMASVSVEQVHAALDKALRRTVDS